MLRVLSSIAHDVMEGPPTAQRLAVEELVRQRNGIGVADSAVVIADTGASRSYNNVVLPGMTRSMPERHGVAGGLNVGPEILDVLEDIPAETVLALNVVRSHL